MKALVLKEYGRLAVEDWAVPELQPGEVLVRVGACGICGSDVHGLDGSTGRRIPPIVMGHEAAGEIARVGSAVTGWQAGDRVPDRNDSGLFGRKVQLPDELAGTLMVFKTYDRLSYALVMQTHGPLHTLDKVRNPS